MLDLIERTRETFKLPPIKYAFFNTGLEMQATKNHVKETAKKYGVEIETYRPKVNIVKATRNYGLPFISKNDSERLEQWQRSDVPLSIREEFFNAVDKEKKYYELEQRYPKQKNTIQYICWCDNHGKVWERSQFNLKADLYEFLKAHPPDFQISGKCCYYCKKQLAHEVQKPYEMVITGERKSEGGVRATRDHQTCFQELKDGRFRLKPLYWVTNKDKQWYKEKYNIRYSDAYEVYGFTRTGCCGCPIPHKAVDDLERLRPYEPNIVQAAWNIFGKSYEYRQRFDQWRTDR